MRELFQGRHSLIQLYLYLCTNASYMQLYTLQCSQEVAFLQVSKPDLWHSDTLSHSDTPSHTDTPSHSDTPSHTSRFSSPFMSFQSQRKWNMKSILMKVNYDPRYVTPHRKTWQNPALITRSTTLQPSAFAQPDGYTSLSTRLTALRDIYLPPTDHQSVCGSLEAAATRQLRQRSRQVSSHISLLIVLVKIAGIQKG